MKSVQRRSLFWSVFSCIRNEYRDLLVNRVNLRIQFECRKMQTRKKSVFGHFSRSEVVTRLTKLNTFCRQLIFALRAKRVLIQQEIKYKEVRNYRVTKSSYEIELRKITSHFELLTRKFLQKSFFRVINWTS